MNYEPRTIMTSHPGIKVSSLLYQSRPNKKVNSRIATTKIQNSRNISHSFRKQRQSNPNVSKRSSRAMAKSTVHNRQTTGVYNRQMTGEQDKDLIDSVRFDARGYGKSLRNSYYLMHHKNLFYQKLLNENIDFDNKSIKLGHIPKNDNKKENNEPSDQEIYKKGINGNVQELMKDSNVSVNKKVYRTIYPKPVQLSMQIINSELKPFKSSHQNKLYRNSNNDYNCQRNLKKELDKRYLLRDIKTNEVLNDFSIKIIKKEMDKNIKELQKTKRNLIAVEQHTERKSEPYSVTNTMLKSFKGQEPNNKQPTDKQLFHLNNKINRRSLSIKQSNNHRTDYLESILNKSKQENEHEQPKHNYLLTQNNRINVSSGSKQSKPFGSSTNPQVSRNNKTMIREVLSNVGKSYLAEEFYNYNNHGLGPRDPQDVAEELFDNIQMKIKLDNLKQKQNNPIIQFKTQDNHRNSESNRASIYRSHKLSPSQNIIEDETRNSVESSMYYVTGKIDNQINNYLTDVLERNEEQYTSYYPTAAKTEKDQVFSYLNTLKKSFEMKEPFTNTLISARNNLSTLV